MGFLTKEEISKIGFRSVGTNVQISERASFYGVENIQIGNNVRIDDFCLISAGFGGVHLCNYIHIAAYSSIIGGGAVLLKDFCNISSRVSIYSSNDDYSGIAMTNPTVPVQYRNVNVKDVVLGKHVIVGSGAIILPGVTAQDCVAIGALSLVKGNCAEFGIYAGIPAKKIGERRRELLEKEAHFMNLNTRKNGN